MSFIHLHVHTDYSTDALSSARDLAMTAKGLGMPGLAITDHGTMAGVPDFVESCEKEGLKPIIGCEFWLKGRDSSMEDRPYHLILLAKNLTGYRNLVRITSISNTAEPHKGRHCITHDLLMKYHEGLICTSACIGGEIPQLILSDNLEKALETARWYRDVFGDDFYIEVSLHRPYGETILSVADDRKAWETHVRELNALQERSNEAIFSIAGKLGIKVVATNDVHFATKDDAIAQDVVLCLNADAKVSDSGRLRYTHQEYLKSREEMQILFPGHPEVLDNTMEVFSKVESFSIWGDFSLPVLTDDDGALLEKKVFEGAVRRFGAVPDDVKERLKFELGRYAKLGAQSYLLILEDLVSWAAGKGIWVGPGRNSAPSSLVLYCLGITEVDPLKAEFLFERFISPEMTGLPDIDLDFEARRRNEVVAYLQERYGACQVRTYGKWSKRTAWLAVSKVMGLPKGTVKRISEAMSDDLSLRMDIEFSSIIHRESSTGSARTREALRNAIRLTDKHSGRNRIHGCAVMLSRDPLASFIPVEENREQLVSQYEAQHMEKAGAVKLDILGLGMLDVIHAACNQVSEESVTPLDIQSIPLDDPEALEVFSRGDTVGVIPFESDGMRDYLRAFRALTFDDLVAMNVLYRPGPIDRIPEFIDAANGNGRRESWSPYVDGFVRNTHGEIVFQEQVMLLASSIGGFSAEEANRFRKDVGRQNVGLANYHSDFISGGLAKGISEDVLESVFHLLLERGKYAFLHTHAYCYTLIGWRLAWLKAHHPKAFFSSLLNTALRMGWDTDEYVADCTAHGLQVTLPGRNASGPFGVGKLNGSR